MNVVLLINALVALFQAVLMLVAAAVDPGSAGQFMEGAGLAALCGGCVLIVALAGGRGGLSRLHGFLLTSSVWGTASVFGALPLWLWGMSWVDALFESVSAVTTTGSTVMSGLESTPHGILIWRAMQQMLGGVGFVVLAMALLPALRVGGMQLFRTESSDQSGREIGSAALFAFNTLGIYLALVVACAAVYGIGGMNAFDAVTHAMTTLSTGGFSNYDSSFGHFDSAFLQWAATFFMAAGGLPFAWYLRLLLRKSVGSEQVRAYLKMLAVVIVVLTLWLWLRIGGSVLDALRLVAFNVVSVVTTTGYATTDYTMWGPFAAAVFFALTAVGGCTGSTSGGVKTMRWVILGRALASSLRRVHQPHGVFPIRYEGQTVEDDVRDGVIAFMSFFLFSVAILAILLGAVGLDLVTAVTGALTALANVGPGLGDVIGPAGNFQSLPDAAKLILGLGMYAGRLEMVTLYVLLLPSFWVETAQAGTGAGSR